MAGCGLAPHLDRSTGRPHLVEDPLGQCLADKSKGKFKLDDLGTSPTTFNFQRWLDAAELVTAEEMLPEDDSRLTTKNAKKTTYLKTGWLFQPVWMFPCAILRADSITGSSPTAWPTRSAGGRRNTHPSPTSMIPCAGLRHPRRHARHEQFHLEQYVEAARASWTPPFTGKRPSTAASRCLQPLYSPSTPARTSPVPNARAGRKADFLDPRQRAYFADFKTVPRTGRYRITIRATGLDRTTYSAADTGAYHGDPIRLTTEMGDRSKTFNLFDGKIREIKLDEWLAAGTRFRLHYPTDGLKFRGNGNFKFQYAIGGEYIKRINPKLWQEVVNGPKARKSNGERRRPETWHNWTDYWQGPRPRLLSATVEGPYYESWPLKRQLALLGRNPIAKNAADILSPIAERAWRRTLRDSELDPSWPSSNQRPPNLATLRHLRKASSQSSYHPPSYCSIQTTSPPQSVTPPSSVTSLAAPCPTPTFVPPSSLVNWTPPRAFSLS